MKTSYLVIWQLEDNKNSRENTPVDVDVSFVSKPLTAQEKYDKIVEQLKKH